MSSLVSSGICFEAYVDKTQDISVCRYLCSVPLLSLLDDDDDDDDEDEEEDNDVDVLNRSTVCRNAECTLTFQVFILQKNSSGNVWIG
jgi:hypothetical protein